MSATVEELTINFEEDGVQVVKELDKVILSKGAWATLLFRYQEWDKAKGEYGSDRYGIRRYRKRGGVYATQGKFNISSADQARNIAQALLRWVDEVK